MSSRLVGHNPEPPFAGRRLAAVQPRHPVRLRGFLDNHLIAMALVGGASYVAFMAVAIVTKPFGARGFVALMDIVPIPVYLLAAAFAVLAARAAAGRGRLAWWLLAAGFFLDGLGDTIWATYEVVFDLEPPAPSFADPFYLAVIPLLLAGIMLLSSSARTPGHYRTALDAAILVLALAAIVWDAILQPILDAAETGWLGTAVTAAYPVGDVMLVFAAVVALRRQWKGRARIVLYTFAAGLLLATGADLAFARMVLDGTYESGSLIDLGWPAGFLLMGVAAAMQARWGVDLAAENAELAPPVWRQLVPLAISVSLVVWLLVRQMAGGLENAPALFGLVVAAVAVAMVRHAVAIVDNRLLNKALAAARDARLWRALGRGLGPSR